MFGCLSFSSKRASRLNRLTRLGARPRRRQHLDGYDLPQPVHGLVDAGHSTLAEPIEYLVLAEEEALGVAANEKRCLVLGDVALLDHPTGKAAEVAGSVAGLALPAREKCLGFVDIQKLAAEQQAVHILDGEFHVLSNDQRPLTAKLHGPTISY